MADYCCPKCGSKAFKRNGFTRHGKQNHRCLECGRQFSLEPSIDQHTIQVQGNDARSHVESGVAQFSHK